MRGGRGVIVDLGRLVRQVVNRAVTRTGVLLEHPLRRRQKAHSRCTNDGTDNQVDDRQRGRVPSDPLPTWVITRRQAIGTNIRAAREVQKYSQEKLGQLVDLDRKTINRIEQGAHAALIDHLIRIAQALEVPLSDLVR